MITQLSEFLRYSLLHESTKKIPLREEIESWFNRTLQVRLKNFRETLAVSRRYAVKLKSKFT